MKKLLSLLLFNCLLNNSFAQLTNPAPYCTSTVSAGCGTSLLNSFVTNGAIANINNTGSGCCNANGYIYYCNHYLAANAGQVINATVSVNTPFAMGIKAVVDWNQDFAFGAGEVIFTSPIISNSVAVTFTVPNGTPNGLYRLRLRGVNLMAGVNIDPCAQYTSGETEDYNFYVGIPAPGSITVSASPTLVCNGSSTSLTATGAASYTWSNGSTGSVAVVSPTAPQTYYVSAPSGSCLSVSSISVNTAPTPSILANTSSSMICLGSSATLSASGGTSYSWTPGGNSASITISPTVNTTYTVTGSDGTCTATSTITQVVVVCAGIKTQQSVSNNLIVFPNPFKDELKIKTSSVTEIKMFSALGQIVFQKTINLEDVIDTDFLNKGVYYLSYNNGETRQVVKLVKN